MSTKKGRKIMEKFIKSNVFETIVRELARGIKSQIDELKDQTVPIKTIGAGLKLGEGGELSIDFATVNDTKNAVNEIIN